MPNSKRKNQSTTAFGAAVITVFEHQRLTTADFVQVTDFHWLMAQELAVFRIKRQRGQWQLKVGHHIGVILLPSGMILEILPKLTPSTEAGQVSQTRRWVQEMISDLMGQRDLAHPKQPHTTNIGQMSTQLKPHLTTAPPLSDWLTAQFFQRLHRHQPTKHYQPKICNQASLQGRIRIKEQIRHNSLQPHKFMCESSVLSQDMLSNRLIKSALVLLHPLRMRSNVSTQPSSWQSVPTLNTQQMLQLAATYQQAKQQLQILPLPVQKRQAMQQLVDSAYWLLRQSDRPTGHMLATNPSFACAQAPPRLCLLINMNQAFEQWASQRIAALFTQISPHHKPSYQTQTVWLRDTEGQACLSIRPDLLIHNPAPDTQQVTQDKVVFDGQQKGRCSHVIDIKWKPMASAASISASDAYQLTSYAQAYQAAHAWLVYPVQGPDRQPVALSLQALNNQEGRQEGSQENTQKGDSHTHPAALWLIPFNVLSGTINDRLCLAINRV